MKAYFGILEDTLLGRWLPAWRRRRKRRLIRAPKFYFFDVGVVNRLARRGPLAPGSELYGRAFENWAFHELSAFRAYRTPSDDLCYWRLAGGTEVDFVLGDMRLAVEAKASARIASHHLRGLRSLADEHPEVGRRIVVCLEPRARRTDDGIDILPAPAFVRRLWQEDLVGGIDAAYPHHAPCFRERSLGELPTIAMRGADPLSSGMARGLARTHSYSANRACPIRGRTLVQQAAPEHLPARPILDLTRLLPGHLCPWWCRSPV